MTATGLRFLIIAWMILMFSSCEKEKDFPRKYVFDSIHPGMIEGYTKTGKITDEAKISDFIKGQSQYFWPSDDQPTAWHFEIEILSDSKAKISDSDETVFYDVIRKNGIMYLQSRDTLMSFMDITNERLKYTPLYMKKHLLPIAAGGQVYEYIPCFYIIESKGGLHIPFVSYVEKLYGSMGEFFSGQGIGNHNNEFNPAYLNKVQNSGNLIDTIVYQDNRIVFKEQ